MSDQMSPMVCADCGRHVPVYLLDEAGTALGDLYCRRCAETYIEPVSDGGEDRP